MDLQGIITESLLEQMRESIEKSLEEQIPELTGGIPATVRVKVTTDDDDMENDLPTSGVRDTSGHRKTDDAPRDAMAELDNLVGLDTVKKEIHSLANLVKIGKVRAARKLPVPDVNQHIVFTGNPGTGKSTVARLLASIYYSIGYLPTDTIVEADRGDLVGGYVGQTALKVKDVFRRAIGGVLFIDEAYSLTQSDAGEDYGPEAVSTLLKLMEDHRDEIVVVAAGYPDLMASFLRSNPGLASRFTHHIAFPDYTVGELTEMFVRACSNSGLSPDKRAVSSVVARYERILANRPENFANGRHVRTFFERVVLEQANRLIKLKRLTTRALSTIIEADVDAADVWQTNADRANQA